MYFMNSYANYPVSGANPIEPLDRMQPIRLERRRKSPFVGCSLAGIFLLIFMCAGAYFLAPVRTNLIVLGLDRAPEGTSLSRTDTMILTTIVPTRPYVGMFSIPRDLWVDIPNYGENRINTVHFFNEAEKKGSGPAAVRQVVERDFGVKVPYYVRIRFDGVVKVVDALGGLTINLSTAQSGYEAGEHTLDGTQALAFVRDRKGSDDFFRMNRGQMAVTALAKQIINPMYWPRLPGAILAGLSVVDTNIPIWDWPRLGFVFLRAAIFGFDTQTVTRDMVTPFRTDQGAQVLLPRWDLIRPAVQAMFQNDWNGHIKHGPSSEVGQNSIDGKPNPKGFGNIDLFQRFFRNFNLFLYRIRCCSAVYSPAVDRRLKAECIVQILIKSRVDRPDTLTTARCAGFLFVLPPAALLFQRLHAHCGRELPFRPDNPPGRLPAPPDEWHCGSVPGGRSMW